MPIRREHAREAFATEGTPPARRMMRAHRPPAKARNRSDDANLNRGAWLTCDARRGRKCRSIATSAAE